MHNQFLIPVLLPIGVPSRIASFRAWGSIAALHLAILGTGPLPISPFLLSSDSSLPTGEVLIRALDHESADVLKPWLDLSHSQELPTSPSDPAARLVMEVFNLQVDPLQFFFRLS